MADAANARPITETPEFHKAVADAVAKAIPDIVAHLSAIRGAPAGDDKAFAEGLAMAIAALTDQGTGRKRVAPEIVEQRSKARTRMAELLIAAKAENRIPSYRLTNKVYLDEVLVDPIYIDPASKSQKPTEIDWPGVPSEAMIPINDVAREIHAAFCLSIGSVAKEHLIAEKPFAVTANGLVVKSGGLALRPASVLGMNPEAQQQATGEGLRIKGRGTGIPGEHKEVRVLGTVAAPARVGA
jgi:hypothetical protein